jgi:hypothetical protein
MARARHALGTNSIGPGNQLELFNETPITRIKSDEQRAVFDNAKCSSRHLFKDDRKVAPRSESTALKLKILFFAGRNFSVWCDHACGGVRGARTRCRVEKGDAPTRVSQSKCAGGAHDASAYYECVTMR